MSETAAAPVDGVEWVRPRPDRAGLRRDLVIALVLAAGTAGSVVLYRATGFGEEAPWWGSALWVPAMTLPLAVRRRWPEAVVLMASVAFVVGVVAEVGEQLFSNICLFVAIYTVGAWGTRRRVATVVRAVIVVGMFAWLFWNLIFYSAMQDYLPELSRDGDGPLSPYLAFGFINVITNLLYFGGAWYFGDAAHRSARARAELEERTRELAAERERTRAQAVALERVRIARELHDVVAHHVSVIGVQAGAARRVIAKEPDAAATSLSAIESSAREAVDELHGLLGTLRADAEPATTSTSTRGVDRLGELVAESTANGLPTTIAVVGDERPASALVGLNAYRIVQEALTNARKHAGPGATAEVRVRWSDEAVEIEITNTGVVTRAAGGAAAGGAGGAGGAGAGAAAGAGDAGVGGAGVGDAGVGADAGGLGQLGMRERVAAVGGVLELGPRARGGYLVRASFPLRRPAGAGS